MPTPHLTAVPGGAPSTEAGGEVRGLVPANETIAQKLRRLQLEARRLGREEIEHLAEDFERVAQRATEVAEGGDAFPAGVRDLCARISDDLIQKSRTLISIMDRSSHA